MRTSIIIAFLIISSLINSVNAQWYNTKYGVDELNDLTDAQLMESYSNARATSIVGGVATFTGIGFMVIGGGMAAAEMGKAIMTWGFYQPEPNKGEGLAIVGAVLTLLGTVTWIAGGSRKIKLRRVAYSRGLVSTISVYPDAGYDLLSHTYYTAVTFKIEF